MDPVTSVFSITVNIAKFISEHGDKTVLQEQIAVIATQVQKIIKPLLTHDIHDEALSNTLHILNLELVNIDNHLRSWKKGWAHRTIAFWNPWAVTQELRDDTQRLMFQFQIFEGAMSTYNFIRGFNVLPSASSPTAFPVQPSTSAHSHAHSHKFPVPDEDEVLRFWHTNIGGDQEIAKSQRLCDHLASWLNVNLKGLAQSRLLLCLDENNSGNVTLRTLQNLVRNMKLREAIVLYSSDPDFPLLIWISDDLEFNAHKVAFARRQGVSVIQLANTSSAKAWINVNKKFLQKHDNASDLRFISDQRRWELDSKNKPFFNQKAGNEMIKFIRDEGFKAPVLIYTADLPATRYVELYESAGSMGGDYDVYKNYIRALASRRNDDRGWMRCAAPPAKLKKLTHPAKSAHPKATHQE